MPSSCPNSGRILTLKGPTSPLPGTGYWSACSLPRSGPLIKQACDTASSGTARWAASRARARGVEPADVVKTLVVRRSSTDEFLFVLIPGDRTISWPKLRAMLKISRLTLPDPAVARDATGYERGTITPFGARQPWPVIADERIAGREITLGAGEPGVAIAAAADDIIEVLGARLADISQPDSKAEMPA